MVWWYFHVSIATHLHNQSPTFIFIIREMTKAKGINAGIAYHFIVHPMNSIGTNCVNVLQSKRTFCTAPVLWRFHKVILAYKRTPTITRSIRNASSDMCRIILAYKNAFPTELPDIFPHMDSGAFISVVISDNVTHKCLPLRRCVVEEDIYGLHCPECGEFLSQ